MVKSRRKSKYQSMVPEFIRLYKQGYSCHSIGKELNVDYRKVWLYLKKEGITVERTIVNRKYKIDENSFDVLDKNSIYWLGCLFGDGSVHGNVKANAIYFHGHIDDIEHGLLFKDFLKSDHPIKNIKNKKGYYFRFSSSKITKRLLELELYPNKTHIMKYPDYIPENLHSHFIRGLFDTDGCISIRMRKRYKKYQGCFSITMNGDMLNAVRDIVEKHLDIKPTTFRRVHNKNTYSISYEGNLRLKKIYDWIYTDAEYHLRRKKDKFQILFNTN